MTNKNILIAGLPEAGKSTYIAALWATTKRTNCSYELSLSEKPNDADYLNKLSDKWLIAEPVDRTLNEVPENITLKWEKKITKELVSLTIPDFKGEIFTKLISGDASQVIHDSFINSKAAIVFINDMDPGTLDGETGDKTEDSPSVNDVFTIESMSKLTQNILLIKSIRESMGDCKIVIAISSWDKKDVLKRRNAENWLKINHKLFYNVIKNNFSESMIVGVSAQGGEYNADNKTELAKKKENRAYIYENSKVYDLTSLLVKLL